MVEATASFTIEPFSASDGYRWRYRRYAPAGPAKGSVVCIHGIQSHGGWYEHSCNRFREAGFDVSFVDRRGSGLNDQARGDAPSFRRLVDDLAEYLRTLRSRRTEEGSRLPVFLVAISWGAKLAVALQRRHPQLVDGLVLVCPGFFPRVKPSRKERLGILLSRLVRPQKLFPIPLNDPQLFTETPRWQDFIRKDPFSLRRATARLLLESARLDGYLRFSARSVVLPVLVLLAERDRIVDNARIRRYVDRFVSADRRVIEYPGAQHTLEFEPNPNRWIADVIEWLEPHALAACARP